MTQTSTGIKLSISSGIPATYDLSGYGALTYFEIGEVTNIPQFGAQFQTVTNQPLATGITEKRKGFVNYGDPVIDMALDNSNMGQQMMKSACDGIRKSQVHAFMLQYGNGEIRYWSGRVFSFQEAPGSANNMVGATSQIGITRAIIQIPRITLDLSFAENFYSLGGEPKNFSDIITFSRSTTSTYFDQNGVMQTAPIDTPCLAYDPTTLEPLGLQVFGAATNLLTYSEQFDDASWVKSSATILANSSTAPDGAMTMDKLEAGSTASISPRAAKTVTVTSGQAYTLYLFAKPSEVGFLQLYFAAGEVAGNPRANFDITSGVVGTVDSGVEASIKALPSGIYQIAVTVTSATTSLSMIAMLAQSATDTREQANNFTAGDGLSIWGAQLEAGSIATPYIKTEASQVTRAADIATVDDLSSWYNQSQGSVFVDAEWLGGTQIDASSRIALSLNDGTASNRILIYNPVSSAGGIVVANGASSSQFRSTSVSTKSKVLASIGDSFSLSVDGEYFSEPLASPPTVDRLKIGRAYNDGSYLEGHIKTLTYYPSALTENEMKLITL